LFDNYKQYTVHANSINLRIQQMIMKNSSRHKYSIPEANLIGQMRNGAAEQGLKMHRTALYLGGKTTVLSFCRTKWMKQYMSKNLPHHSSTQVCQKNNKQVFSCSITAYAKIENLASFSHAKAKDL